MLTPVIVSHYNLGASRFVGENRGMAILVTLQGPDAGRKYPLNAECTVIGRQFDASICLTGRAVSRHHAQILRKHQHYFVEDLGSSNGTFINGKRIPANTPQSFSERDSLQIGPYLFALRPAPELSDTDRNLVVREQLSALAVSESVYRHDPALKLQVVLEISQNLARTLDLEPLLEKLLEQLMRLFPQSDRAMVLLYEGEELYVRGQRCRHDGDASMHPYSRTIVRKALTEGVGLLSEDARVDERFEASATLTSLNLHSLICVPLIGHEGKRLGAIQVDRFHKGVPFRSEDLQLLATICLQMSVALENAELHAERLREQRLRQELAFAREIQQGFLPTELEGFPQANFEILGRVDPARQVAGDLYDFLCAPDGRLAFFIGDVSGKGIPAALFMVAVRILCRHLAGEAGSPSQTLTKLNATLAADNPAGMFVTLIHGLYEPATGEVVLASAGHPPPILRRADGSTEEVALTNGRLVGFDEGDFRLHDFHLTLQPGDALVFYTDGVTEARQAGTHDMFETTNLQRVVARFDSPMSLEACAELLKHEVDAFTGSNELQDDLTVLILRRTKP